MMTNHEQNIEGQEDDQKCLSHTGDDNLNVDTRPDLVRLFENREWDVLRAHLSNIEQDDASYSQISDKRPESQSELTYLGIAICYSAPLDIIERIIEIDTSLPTECDEFGLSVLHLGCLNGAHSNVIQFLLTKYGHLAKEVDNDGRSPLHHAVEFACCSVLNDKKCCDGDDDAGSADVKLNAEATGTSLGGDKKSSTPPKHSYIETLKMLCAAKPEMVFAKDKYDITPVDMVQDEKAFVELGSPKHLQLELIYRILQSVSINIYRWRKRQWEQEKEPYTNTAGGGGRTRKLMPRQDTSLAKSSGKKRGGIWSDILNEKRKIQATGNMSVANDWKSYQ